MHQPDDPKLPNWSRYLAGLEQQAQQAGKQGGGEEPAASSEPEAVAAPDVSAVKKPLLARLSLGGWAYYFIAKLALVGLGLIAFHPAENLAFAVFLLLPLPSGLLARLKGFSSLVIGIALLYYDSWLPPIERVIAKAPSLAHFSTSYLFELVTRFFSLQAIALLAMLWLAYRLLSRRVNFGALVIFSMLGLWALQSAKPLMQEIKGGEQLAANTMPDMDRVLRNFFDNEAWRSVSLAKPEPDAAPFDIVFVHVCSLSWDDVRATGLEQHPLWGRFDIMLTKFNSAASYSGPAAIHLLRATCGQQEHGKMYATAPSKCYLMNGLKNSGYEPELAMNHNGQFDDFLGQVQTYGEMNMPPMPLDGVEIAQESFYATPVYDDLSLIRRWSKNRARSGKSRVALYYDTVSLHDGNHLQGTEALPNTLKTYRTRLVKFLDEMEKIMQTLENSERRTVVVMVSDHGGAVRGDKMQIAGLRELPTPAITMVPVGIRVIGGRRQGQTLAVDQPTSYLAIAQILARMLEKSPYGDSFLPADYTAELPVTPYVAQNEKLTVAEYNGRYYLNRGDAGWMDYTEFNEPAP